jgi:hypothetical protein
MKIKSLLLLLAVCFSASSYSKDFFRFKSGELLITDKGMSRSYVLSLIQAQTFSKKISRNRYILVNSMSLKFDVYFEFNRSGNLIKITSRQK